MLEVANAASMLSMKPKPILNLGRGIALFVLGTSLAATGANAATADALSKGAAAYKPYAVEQISNSLTAAKELQASVAAKDVAKAQKAWIKSRIGWERAEPITGEFFPDLDSAIDAWPDSKHGFHAIEAPLFAGKLEGIEPAVNELVGNLAEFDKKLRDPSFSFTPHGILTGTTGLAYEVGENKSKGGESQFAGTSLDDMRNNVHGIEAAYDTALRPALKAKNAKRASEIHEQIEKVETLVKVKDLKALDQGALRKESEELAVDLQQSVASLGVEKPKLGE